MDNMYMDPETGPDCRLSRWSRRALLAVAVVGGSLTNLFGQEFRPVPYAQEPFTAAEFARQNGERSSTLTSQIPRSTGEHTIQFQPARYQRSRTQVESRSSQYPPAQSTHRSATSSTMFPPKEQFRPVSIRRESPVMRSRHPQTQHQQTIRPVQHVRPNHMPLPPEILAMPTVRETLEVIHHRSQLLIARSNITRTAIANDSVIDVVQFSPREISIIGVGYGSTTLTLWFENNPQPLIYLVTTIRDPSLEEQMRLDYGKLERKLQVLFPNSKVYLIPLSRKIVVKGQARDAGEAARILQIVRNEVINQNGNLYGPQPNGNATSAGGLAQAGYPGGGVTNAGGVNGQGLAAGDLASSYIVNMLRVPGEYQVMLRVRIAELNRSQLQRMGIDFNYLFNNGRHAIGYAMGGLPSTISGIFENGEIQVLVNWLASNGTAKILSEPVLTVLSGHTASMLSGGEFAVPTIVGIGGAQGQQTSFRGFGTSLFVTPTVVDRDLIRMSIRPEFSAVNNGNAVNGIPGVDSRSVNTTVELREGQTIALAGLISHQTTTEVTRIPFLSDIPYLGPKLFSAKRSTIDETELLVLVTPHLVRAMDADEVPPVPGYYVTPPSEHELYRYGMTEGAPDQQVYQLAPFGRGAGVGEPVGYRLHNPSPATPGYPPAVTDPYGANRPQWPQQPAPRVPQYRGSPNRPSHQPSQQYVPPAPTGSGYQPQYQQPGFPAPRNPAGFRSTPVPNTDSSGRNGFGDQTSGPAKPPQRGLFSVFRRER